MNAHLVATRDQIRELDRIAIEDYGVPGLILMENAGRRCACAAAEMLGDPAGRRVAILCGRGNNGGDGFVVARHLTNWGAGVEVLLLAAVDEVLGGSDETSANLRIVQSMGIPLVEAPEAGQFRRALGERTDSDLLVDGLLGTGIRGEVREPFLSAIRAVNECAAPVLAIDVPSGLDCDTGEPLGEAVRAERTVTFVCRKVGFAQPGAEQYTGRVEVAEISIPRAAVERMLGGPQG
ncbi:MAG: NAD(P)H-hydrate epimerase [Planctomycetota bacterium]|jgi:NAD(P)H-hydrate epimerase